MPNLKDVVEGGDDSIVGDLLDKDQDSLNGGRYHIGHKINATRRPMKKPGPSTHLNGRLKEV